MRDEDKTKEQLIEELNSLRRQLDKTLQESDAGYRFLIETTSDWMWQVDQNGVYTYASDKSRDLLGYEPEEIIGKTPFDFMPEDEAKRVASEFAVIVRERRCFKIDNVNRKKDGSLIVLETNGAPLLDNQGNFCGYHGFERDITDRVHLIEEKKAVEELKKSRDELAEKVEELEKFTEFALDRETRISELKKEVETLKKMLKFEGRG